MEMEQSICFGGRAERTRHQVHMVIYRLRRHVNQDCLVFAVRTHRIMHLPNRNHEPTLTVLRQSFLTIRCADQHGGKALQLIFIK